MNLSPLTVAGSVVQSVSPAQRKLESLSNSSRQGGLQATAPSSREAASTQPPSLTVFCNIDDRKHLTACRPSFLSGADRDKARLTILNTIVVIDTLRHRGVLTDPFALVHSKGIGFQYCRDRQTTLVASMSDPRANRTEPPKVEELNLDSIKIQEVDQESGEDPRDDARRAQTRDDQRSEDEGDTQDISVSQQQDSSSLPPTLAPLDNPWTEEHSLGSAILHCEPLASDAESSAGVWASEGVYR